MARMTTGSIRGCVQAGAVADCDCGAGRLVFTAYGPRIVHVAFYPGAPVPLPMWGIAGAPDEACAWQVTESAERIVLRNSDLSVDLERHSGAFAIRGADGAVVPVCRELACEPATVSGEPTFHLHARFDAPATEHYYGLGQHQRGWMDQRDREVLLWHDYKAEGGEIIAVPFLVSSAGYGLVWDNPSRSRVHPGGKDGTAWWAEVGEAVSFFVITGPETDTLYRGYRALTGAVPLPPLAALGYIQCKQRYASRDELMQVARAYREKGYPCDILVVDWFHWKVLGDMDLNPEAWPDPAGMNAELAAMGYQVMISCWPRFKKDSRHYDTLESRGLFMKTLEGESLYGTPKDTRGALIDTTHPAAADWYWQTIRAGYAAYGFRSWWLDEDEPDICPHPYRLHAGTGARVHNLYPLTHTAAVYEGHRRDLKTRPLILSRSAYHGAQRYGTTFWSSDIYPTWDVYRRQIPAGLNFCASGMPYWSSDIGGWQPLPKSDAGADGYKALLLETDEAKRCTETVDDYAELYVRWFQYGTFCPTLRAHGTRPANEVWSFGKTAERILAEYLRLRYRLLPYLYSLAYRSMLSGAPFMRALFMDFPGDDSLFDIRDQYMFGPAFLVAPVTEPGARKRTVRLPGGTDWFDFWTGQSHSGGQAVEVDAPLERMPLFVRAGAIIPMGEVIPHTGVPQRDIQVHVYPGADATFALYRDDGISLAYEQGDCAVVQLVWNDAARKLDVRNDSGLLFQRPQSEWLRVAPVA